MAKAVNKQEIKLWEQDIPYYTEGLETPNSMSAYFLDTDKPLPCVLVIPGGSYRYREKGEAEPIAEFFNENGMHAAILNYRVAPNRHPAPLCDAQRAVKLLRHNTKEWSIRPDGIIAAGFSAGGHLCASTVTLPDHSTSSDEIDRQSAIPNIAVLSYPVINVCDEFGHANSGKNLLGEDYDRLCGEFCLEGRVHENMPPVFIWHTVEDSCVNVKNSLIFGEKLKDVGVPFEMHIFPYGRHGLALGKGLPDVGVWTSRAVEFIKSHIK